MTKELDPELWHQAVSSVALQHNSESRCAVQLVALPGEELHVVDIRNRLMELVDPSQISYVPSSSEIRKSLRDCFVRNQTFVNVGEGDHIFQKVPDPVNDAIAGHSLHISQFIPPRLMTLLGRTNSPFGTRRSGVFALGVLRHMNASETPINGGELARRLETTRATIGGHIRRLGALGVLTYADESRPIEGSMLSPKFKYVIAHFIEALESVIQEDESAIQEGIVLGRNILNDPDTLTALLRKGHPKPVSK